jgi:hypothetical protein
MEMVNRRMGTLRGDLRTLKFQNLSGVQQFSVAEKVFEVI